jgi:hypothetical protein
VLEFIKRWRADRRKGQAYRRLLARECELNLWPQWRLEETLREIQHDAERGVKAEYTIRTLPNGDVEWRRSAGAEYASGTLSDARTDLMSKIMVDVATLDQQLFRSLEDAYNSLITMRHVRASLIQFVTGKTEEDRMHLEGFPEYGLSELEGVKGDLDWLYRQCTGHPIDKVDKRVRG